MSITSYAQNFEDVLLWRALGEVENGSYLDVGAQDPVHDSVSLAFYEAGWRGTHVEPTPRYADLLRQARPDEKVIQAAVSASPGPIKFYEFPDTGLSTGRSAIAKRHASQGFVSRELVVPTVRLSQLLELTGEVHWLKIDVEGMEADVLASWDDHPVRPWVLVIEATIPSSQEPSDKPWRRHVEKRGYGEVHFDGLSRHFVHQDHEDLAEHFRCPPNVFDLFRISDRHFSAQSLVEERETARLAAENRLAALTEEADTRASELRTQATDLRNQLEAAGEEARDVLHRLSAEEHRTAQLTGELELTRHRIAELEGELAQSRQLELAARDKADQFRADHIAALDALAAAEKEHRDATHLQRREQQAAGKAHRDELRQVERRLRDTAATAQRMERRLRERLATRDADIALQAEKSRQDEKIIADLQAEQAELQRQVAGLRQRLATDAATAEHMLAATRKAHQQEAGAWQARHQELSAQLQLVEQAKAALGATAADLQQRVTKADELINEALSSKPGRWQKLGLALGLAQPEEIRSVLQVWQSMHPLPPASGCEEDNMIVPSSVEPPRNPYLRADSLAELLAWHDVDFVRCAYVTVLGRQPDPEGEAYYTDRIRRGHSKMEMLWTLRRSEEGANHDPGIAGLDKELKTAALSRHWLIGWAVRPITRCESDSGMMRSARAAANTASMIHQGINQHSIILSNINASLHTLHGLSPPGALTFSYDNATLVPVVNTEDSGVSPPHSRDRELAPTETSILTRLELLHSASTSNGIL